MAITNDNKIYTWGLNDCGQLGNGTYSTNSSVPTAIDFPKDSGIPIKLGCGALFSAALTSDGSVYTWGSNSQLQLGREARMNDALPGKVPLPAPAIDLACGHQHVLVTLEDYSLCAWGRNIEGCLGIGALSDKTKPTCLPTLQGVSKIACGSLHSLALLEDGSLYNWGSLGNFHDRQRHTHTPELLLKGVREMASGGSHNLALMEDGTVWAWGGNCNGQMGIGHDGAETHRPFQMIQNFGGMTQSPLPLCPLCPENLSSSYSCFMLSS
jgi:alpha-tubulin suppressor-like RCC1 family protein